MLTLLLTGMTNTCEQQQKPSLVCSLLAFNEM